MILVVAIQESNCVVDVVTDAVTTGETPGLRWACQCINLLIARDGVTTFISTCGGSHVFANAAVVLNIDLAVPVANSFALVLMAEMTLHIFSAIDGRFQCALVTGDHVSGREAIDQSGNGVQILDPILLLAFSA